MGSAHTTEMVEKLSWLVVNIGLFLLLLRLWRAGLLRRYRYFGLYIGVELVQTAALLLFARESNAYSVTYLIFAAVQALLAILVVLELYGLVLEGFEGIGSLSRWIMSGGLAISFLIAILTLYPDLADPATRSPALLYLAVFQRAVFSALLFFLLLISAFLVWFPVPLSRNTMWHAIIVAVYFSSTSILLLIRNVTSAGKGSVYVLSSVSMLVYALCVIAWNLVLSPDGEERSVVLGQRWRPGDGDRLVEQLNSINATLLRAARK